jgi:peptide/nickel transport system permease protein
LLRVLARRLATAALTLLLVTLLVFALAHLAPGDALTFAGDEERPADRRAEMQQELRRLYHLDRPLHEQYGRWLGGVLRGDLGRSFIDRRPVRDKIAARLPVTLVLNVAALALMVLLSVPLGALSAWRPGSWLDRLAGGGTYALYALPAFWGGLLLQIVFAVRLGWLPLSGLETEGVGEAATFPRLMDRAAHLVLPVVCLAYSGLAYLSRFVRATLLEGSRGDSVRAARARGLSELAVLVRHGFRQAAVPMLTLAGLLLPGLVTGSVIVENVFSIPGLGRLLVDAVFQRDLPVLMGLTLLAGAATLGGILAADLTYALVDPRMRREGRGG